MGFVEIDKIKGFLIFGLPFPSHFKIITEWKYLAWDESVYSPEFSLESCSKIFFPS